MGHDIFFDELTHVYLVDGVEVPSVTTILQPLSNRSFSSINPSVLEYARNRGTAVHESLEIYDLGGELEATPETAPYIQAYLDFCDVYRPAWADIEQIVYSEAYGFIGTLDRAGTLNGTEKVVLDLKTSQPTKEALVSVCIQTTAYALAYDFDNFNTFRRYGLFLKSNGTYRLVDCKEYETKYDIDSYAVLMQLLNLRKTIDRILETKAREK